MSPINEKNWWGARAKSPALPCGVVDEPAKAGGTAVLTALQASSLQRHAHHAGSRLTWVNIGSTSHPPSRATQGPDSPPILGHQHTIEQAFQLAGALGQFAVAEPRAVLAAEQLVGDVERGQHRQPQ